MNNSISLKINILKSFQTQLIKFFDELIEQFPLEGDLVAIRIFLKDQIPIETTMIHFINKILPLRDYIIKKDESFFLDNNDLFIDISKDKVNHFKKLWPKLDNCDKDTVWKWFDIFIIICDRYKKLL